MGLLFSGILDQLKYATHRRLTKGLRCFHDEQACEVYATRNHFAACFDGAWHAFARQCCRIKLRRAFHNDAIDGHTLARLYDNLAANGNAVGIDLLQIAVRVSNVREIGGDVHHRRNRFAAFADRILLKQLAHLVKQHNCRAFGHMRAGVREENERECANRRYCHKEILIEQLAVFDIARSLEQNVVAGNRIRNKV